MSTEELKHPEGLWRESGMHPYEWPLTYDPMEPPASLLEEACAYFEYIGREPSHSNASTVAGYVDIMANEWRSERVKQLNQIGELLISQNAAGLLRVLQQMGELAHNEEHSEAVIFSKAIQIHKQSIYEQFTAMTDLQDYGRFLGPDFGEME